MNYLNSLKVGHHPPAFFRTVEKTNLKLFKKENKVLSATALTNSLKSVGLTRNLLISKLDFKDIRTILLILSFEKT